MLLRPDERAPGPHDGSNPNPPAVLLGGSANTVSVARSLWAAGVPVVALGHADSPVRHSRACDAFVDLGRDDGVQDRWLRWLQDGPSGAVLLPCEDDGLELIIRHRRRLTHQGYRLIETDGAVARDMLDKNRTYALARELGIPAPRTLTVRTMADIDAAAGELEYPCALKPVHSHRFQRRTGTGVKAFVVQDAEELRDRFASAQERGAEMLAQRLAPQRALPWQRLPGGHGPPADPLGPPAAPGTPRAAAGRRRDDRDQGDAPRHHGHRRALRRAAGADRPPAELGGR